MTLNPDEIQAVYCVWLIIILVYLWPCGLETSWLWRAALGKETPSSFSLQSAYDRAYARICDTLRACA